MGVVIGIAAVTVNILVPGLWFPEEPNIYKRAPGRPRDDDTKPGLVFICRALGKRCRPIAGPACLWWGDPKSARGYAPT